MSVAIADDTSYTQAEKWLLRTLGPDGETWAEALPEHLSLAPPVTRRLIPSLHRFISTGLVATRQCECGHTYLRLTPEGVTVASSFGITQPDALTRTLCLLRGRSSLRAR